MFWKCNFPTQINVLLIEISLYLNHCLDSPIHKGNVSATASAMRKKLTVDDLRSFLLATIADKIFPMKNKQKYCYFLLFPIISEKVTGFTIQIFLYNAE